MSRNDHDYTADAAAAAEQAQRRRDAAARMNGYYQAEDERLDRQARRNGTAFTDFNDLDELAARRPDVLDKLPPGVRMAAGYAKIDRARRGGQA